MDSSGLKRLVKSQVQNKDAKNLSAFLIVLWVMYFQYLQCDCLGEI